MVRSWQAGMPAPLPMKRTTAFCLLSATVGALAATAYHQTGHRWSASAQEPIPRAPTLRTLELGPVVPPSSAFGSGLDEFAPEERTNILVYEKANRAVVNITTKSAQRELLF